MNANIPPIALKLTLAPLRDCIANTNSAIIILKAFIDGINLSGLISAILDRDSTNDLTLLTTTNKPIIVLSFILTLFIILIEVDRLNISALIEEIVRNKVSSSYLDNSYTDFANIFIANTKPSILKTPTLTLPDLDKRCILATKSPDKAKIAADDLVNCSGLKSLNVFNAEDNTLIAIANPIIFIAVLGGILSIPANLFIDDVRTLLRIPIPIPARTNSSEFIPAKIFKEKARIIIDDAIVNKVPALTPRVKELKASLTPSKTSVTLDTILFPFSTSSFKGSIIGERKLEPLSFLPPKDLNNLNPANAVKPVIRVFKMSDMLKEDILFLKSAIPFETYSLTLEKIFIIPLVNESPLMFLEEKASLSDLPKSLNEKLRKRFMTFDIPSPIL